MIAAAADQDMPAVLSILDVRSTWRASLFDAETPVHGLTHVNQLICADSRESMFVTLFYAQINTGDAEVASHFPVNKGLLRSSK